MRVPSSVRTVAEVIGMDAAVRLMRATYGNRQVYVPARDISDHRLASVLRPDELSALRRTFGGELLPYPSARGTKRRIEAERRTQAIQQDIEANMPTREIAAKHGVSERYVRRFKAKGTGSSGWKWPAGYRSRKRFAQL
jgi:hypothetical protein